MSSLLKPGSATENKARLSYHPLFEKIHRSKLQSKASVTVQQLKGHADVMWCPWVTVTCRMLSHLQEKHISIVQLATT